jgi:methylenetetrahydrofolate reductase (NADPH)
VRKAKAGADSAITQYFFNADSYFYFVERVRLGVDIPVVPGIMPITNYSKLARFSDACGAEIPLDPQATGSLWRRHRQHPGLRRGHHRMCERLLQGGAPGLHFYTLNQAEPSLAIWNNLKLPR